MEIQPPQKMIWAEKVVYNAAPEDTKERRSPEGYTQHTCCTTGSRHTIGGTDRERERKRIVILTQDSYACCLYDEREREGKKKKIEDKSHTIETTWPLGGVTGLRKRKLTAIPKHTGCCTCDDREIICRTFFFFYFSHTRRHVTWATLETHLYFRFC